MKARLLDESLFPIPTNMKRRKWKAVPSKYKKMHFFLSYKDSKGTEHRIRPEVPSWLLHLES